MKITAEPRSDQWNAEDFLGGPRDFTIAGVKVGAAEQKYDIELVEGDGRVWRPPPTVLRLLIKAWDTDDSTVWVGRRVRLFMDPTITFGRDRVGGIRVSHVSHIDEPVSAMLTETRGKRKSHTVEPLREPTTDERIASLRAEWKHADAERKKAIEAEVAALTTPAADVQQAEDQQSFEELPGGAV